MVKKFQPDVATEYELILPDGSTQQFLINLYARPRFADLQKLIFPLIGDHFEHVVLNCPNRRKASMFVDEAGALKGLAINPHATALSRVGRGHGIIVGPAVVFNRNVWF